MDLRAYNRTWVAIRSRMSCFDLCACVLHHLIKKENIPMDKLPIASNTKQRAN